MKSTQILAPILLGVFGGVLGSFFIMVQTKLGAMRKKYVNTTPKKIFETAIFAAVTMSVCCFLVANVSSCEVLQPVPEYELDDKATQDRIFTSNKWNCQIGDKGDEDLYNPLATLFFSTEKDQIHTLFANDDIVSYKLIEIFVFFITWYF